MYELRLGVQVRIGAVRVKVEVYELKMGWG